MRRRAEQGARVALALAGLLAAGLLAEAGLRAYAALVPQFGHPMATLGAPAPRVETYGAIGYRQHAGASFPYSNGTRATANAQGFRGPAVDVPKPPGRRRILLFGGSTTHGWAVDDDQTLDAYMRKLLVKGRPDGGYDVVNLAFDGYDSYQILERLKSDGLPLDPDVLIVNAGINEVRNALFEDLQDPDPRTLLYRGGERRSPVWGWLKAHLFLARIPGYVQALRSHASFGEARARAQSSPNPAAAEYFARNLRRIADLVRARRTALVFSTPPSALRTSKYRPSDTSSASYWLANAGETQAYRDLLAREMEAVARELRSQGVPVRYLHVGLAPELFQDDCHLTAAGNAALAAEFVKAVEELLAQG
jgi:lysophospholipase L1-like esterase